MGGYEGRMELAAFCEDLRLALYNIMEMSNYVSYQSNFIQFSDRMDGNMSEDAELVEEVSDRMAAGTNARGDAEMVQFFQKCAQELANPVDVEGECYSVRDSLFTIMGLEDLEKQGSVLQVSGRTAEAASIRGDAEVAVEFFKKCAQEADQNDGVMVSESCQSVYWAIYVLEDLAQYPERS